jgi:putative transport protein
MIAWLAAALRDHPVLALFLVVALGHAIGRLRLGPVRLNVVIGVLIAGVAVGQAGIAVPAAMQWAFFCLFLFSIGYRTGPQFFRGLGRGALPQIALTVVLCGSGLAVTIVISRLLGFDAGAAAGLLAGGLNASAAIGTGSDAIAGPPIDEAARQALATNVTVAFAVTYLAGLVATILTLAKVGPWILRIDLAAECRKLEAAIGVDAPDPGVVSAYTEHAVRAFTLPAALDGRRVSDLEAGFAPARVFVERVRAAGGIVDADPGTMLHTGDSVVLSGPRQALADPRQPLSGHEVDDAELLDVPVMEADVVVIRREFAGRTLAAIREIVERDVPARGVFVRRIRRAGQEIPRGRDVVVERGDVVTLVGTRRHIDRIAGRVGSLRRRTLATDLLMVGAAIAVGGIVGLPALRIAGLDLGLSMPVGVLAGGLVAGWLRSVHPLFGQVPEPAL